MSQTSITRTIHDETIYYPSMNARNVTLIRNESTQRSLFGTRLPANKTCSSSSTFHGQLTAIRVTVPRSLPRYISCYSHYHEKPLKLSILFGIMFHSVVYNTDEKNVRWMIHRFLTRCQRDNMNDERLRYIQSKW